MWQKYKILALDFNFFKFLTRKGKYAGIYRLWIYKEEIVYFIRSAY